MGWGERKRRGELQQESRCGILRRRSALGLVPGTHTANPVPHFFRPPPGLCYAVNCGSGTLCCCCFCLVCSYTTTCTGSMSHNGAGTQRQTTTGLSPCTYFRTAAIPFPMLHYLLWTLFWRQTIVCVESLNSSVADAPTMAIALLRLLRSIKYTRSSSKPLSGNALLELHVCLCVSHLDVGGPPQTTKTTCTTTTFIRSFVVRSGATTICRPSSYINIMAAADVDDDDVDQLACPKCQQWGLTVFALFLGGGKDFLALSHILHRGCSPVNGTLRYTRRGRSQMVMLAFCKQRKVATKVPPCCCCCLCFVSSTLLANASLSV